MSSDNDIVKGPPEFPVHIIWEVFYLEFAIAIRMFKKKYAKHSFPRVWYVSCYAAAFE